jgi:ribosomal protein S3
MSATGKAYMIAQMQAYFTKVKAAITSGGAASFRYKTGTVPANGQTVYDAPTELGFAIADYHLGSIGIQLSMVDPTVQTNPPIVDALTVLRYEIQANGQIVIKSNYNGVVTYHIRVTMPVKK